MQRGLYVGKRELGDQIQNCRKDWMAEREFWVAEALAGQRDVWRTSRVGSWGQAVDGLIPSKDSIL